MNYFFKKTCFFILIIIPGNCFCQGIAKSEIANITKINFFCPGISFEKRIGNFQSLYVQLFMTPAFFIDYSEALGITSSLHFDPAAILQYRYYYNSATRAANGRRIDNNNLNYISLILEPTLITEKFLLGDYIEKEHHLINKVGVAWGFQRNYKKRFSIDLSFGAGYLFKKTTITNADQLVTKNIGEFTTLGQLSLGFWLNRRIKNGQP